MLKIIIIIVLANTIGLYSKDYLELEKTFDLNAISGLIDSELIDVAFSESNIYVLIKTRESKQGYLTFVKNFQIKRFDFNLNLKDEIQIENIIENDSLYQFLPNKFFINNDTLYLYAQFVYYEKDNYKNWYNLAVLKFKDNKEIFRNYNFIYGEHKGSSIFNNENLTLTYDNNYIYVAYKSTSIDLLIYDLKGNYINQIKIIDDSLSNGLSGKEGEVYINYIKKEDDKLLVFYNKITQVSKKQDFYINEYDENFNLLKETKYKERSSLLEIKDFNFEDNKIFIFNELISGASTISSYSGNHLFKYSDSNVELKSSIGINYPDEIMDLVKFNNGYLAVGSHRQLSNPPYATTIIQKLNSDFQPTENFKVFNEENNKSNYAVKVKVLNKNEYIVVGSKPLNNEIYLAKFNTILSVENNKNEKYTLFPNPSSDFINVLGVKATDKYEISDMLGNKISEGIYNNKIDISHFSKGYYFLKINNQTIKFIKK